MVEFDFSELLSTLWTVVYWKKHPVVNSSTVQFSYIYTNEINEPVFGCADVCVGGCVFLSGYAFRRASRYGAETWHGGRGRAP